VFVDARTVPDEAHVDTDVAVVGAGAAGIAVALELGRAGIRTVLVESGGLDRDPRTDDLNVGESDGLEYLRLEACRSRFLGGSTNCWGGGCRPLQRHDFEPRAWVHGSGWPIAYDDVMPYYERAGTLLRLGRVDYDPDSWERLVGHPRARLLRLDADRVTNEIRQFGPVESLGSLYRDELGRAATVRCLLHANLVGIDTDAAAGRVERVRIATLTGRRFHVVPRVLVLAMGGIENARALLMPQPGAPSGLGNANGLVGRYFMEHPSYRSGVLVRADGAPALDFYDTTYSYRNDRFAAEGVSVASAFSLAPAVQEAEELMQGRMILYTTFAGEDTAGRDALRRLVGRHRGARRHRGRDVATFLRHAPSVATGVVARKARRLARRTHLFTIVEPEPDPESRVTLARDRDALGVNRVRLTLRLTSRVERTLVRAQRTLADELERAGVGTIEQNGARQLDWCCHHIGTTRMSTDERHGVVNPDGRLHGVENLYVAGSSVFPTAGNDMPTYTIVALAIRLADHLRLRLGTG
jgi:choline dehydrogenase-like flavoprotein